jgi:hypothetical protein
MGSKDLGTGQSGISHSNHPTPPSPRDAPSDEIKTTFEAFQSVTFSEIYSISFPLSRYLVA